MALTKGEAWKLILPVIFGAVSPILQQKVPQYPWLAKLLLGMALASLLVLVFSQASRFIRTLLAALGLAVPSASPYLQAWSVRLVSVEVSVEVPLWVLLAVVSILIGLGIGALWLSRRFSSSVPCVPSYDHDRFWDVDWHWTWPRDGGAPYDIIPRCTRCGMVLHPGTPLRTQCGQPKRPPGLLTPQDKPFVKLVATERDPIYLDCDDCKEHYVVKAGVDDVRELESLILRKIDKTMRLGSQTEKDGQG